MNKKETAELGALKMELAMSRAFRFSEKVEPDIPPPTESATITLGWSSHAWSDGYRVEKGCSSSIGHGDGWDKTTSQGARHLFSERISALRAARNQMERNFARKLAEIDAEIEREKAG